MSPFCSKSINFLFYGYDKIRTYSIKKSHFLGGFSMFLHTPPSLCFLLFMKKTKTIKRRFLTFGLGSRNIPVFGENLMTRIHVLPDDLDLNTFLFTPREWHARCLSYQKFAHDNLQDAAYECKNVFSANVWCWNVPRKVTSDSKHHAIMACGRIRIYFQGSFYFSVTCERSASTCRLYQQDVRQGGPHILFGGCNVLSASTAHCQQEHSPGCKITSFFVCWAISVAALPNYYYYYYYSYYYYYYYYYTCIFR
jgi:hypothetical protein